MLRLTERSVCRIVFTFDVEVMQLLPEFVGNTLS